MPPWLRIELYVDLRCPARGVTQRPKPSGAEGERAVDSVGIHGPAQEDRRGQWVTLAHRGHYRPAENEFGAGVVGPGNAGTFALYIADNYFSVVALNFADTTSLDHSIAADLNRNHNYHKIQVVPYGAGPAGPAVGEYVIWQYEPKP